MSEPEIIVEKKVSAVTSDHIIWSVEKVYVNDEFPLDKGMHRWGFNLLPPQGQEILIASARRVDAPDLDNALNDAQWEEQLLRIGQHVKVYREHILKANDKNSF